MNPQAELRRLTTTAGDDLESYRPDDPCCFCLWIRAGVGLKGMEGAEDFDMQVCTPAWLMRECADRKVIWGRHMLIVETFDLDRIRDAVRHQVANSVGRDWDEIAMRLNRHAHWEFEDDTALDR